MKLITYILVPFCIYNTNRAVFSANRLIFFAVFHCHVKSKNKYRTVCVQNSFSTHKHFHLRIEFKCEMIYS